MLRFLVLVTVVCLLSSFTTIASGQNRIWRPYFELEGRAGGVEEVGQGKFILPIRQDEFQLLFADLRGQWSDDQSAEGNWGLAHRNISADGWIFGKYAFYDLKQSRSNNDFQQLTLGLELLNEKWGFRFNGYIADSKAGSIAPAGNVAFFNGNNIFVQQGQERAYDGWDLEGEKRLWSTANPCESYDEYSNSGRFTTADIEVWTAAGGFCFDNEGSGFEQIAGPRVRVEVRMFDLPYLGFDSRLVLGARYEYDSVRGSLASGILSVRIPFGPGGGRHRQPLTGLDRRMVAPIVRDFDVVTNVGLADPERAKFASTGNLIVGAVVVDGNSVNPEVIIEAARSDSVVIANGNVGSIYTASSIDLNTGQVLMGGGSSLAVVGCDTGASAEFQAAGSRPMFIGAPQNSYDVFTIANDATIQGVEISGGRNGIAGDQVTGITILNNTIRDAGLTGMGGVSLTGVTRGDIIGNTVTGYLSGNGIHITSFRSGKMDGNEATGNRVGFYVPRLNGGSVSNNIARDNILEGMNIRTIDQGSVTNNAIDNNGRNGLEVVDLNNGIVSGNISNSNRLHGFKFDDVNGGSIINNITNNNLQRGITIQNVSDASINGNTANENLLGISVSFISDSNLNENIATNNSSSGINISHLDRSQMIGNLASDNRNQEGFKIYRVTDSTLIGNIATNNELSGFNMVIIEGNSVVAGNSSDNNEHGFLMGVGLFGGVFEANIANDNRIDGFRIALQAGTSLSNNTARNNGGDGFHYSAIRGISNGNTADANGGDGFEIHFSTAFVQESVFTNNSSINNTDAGYKTLNSPAVAGNNTGSGNGSNDNGPN